MQSVFVEIKFPVAGIMIPADHSYFLYAALSRLVPALHAAEHEKTAILGISGLPNKDRTLSILPGSKLRMRVRPEKIRDLLFLAGKTLKIGESKVQLGIPQSLLIRPKSNLYSRLVTIKNALTEELFIEAVKKHCVALNIFREPVLFRDPPAKIEGKTVRKTVRIQGKEVVGFPVIFHGLSPEESLILQEHGLGGRRKMGCGSFVGVRV